MGDANSGLSLLDAIRHWLSGASAHRQAAHPGHADGASSAGQARAAGPGEDCCEEYRLGDWEKAIFLEDDEWRARLRY